RRGRPSVRGRRGPPWEPRIRKRSQKSFKLLDAARDAQSTRAFLFMGGITAEVATEESYGTGGRNPMSATASAAKEKIGAVQVEAERWSAGGILRWGRAEVRPHAA